MKIIHENCNLTRSGGSAIENHLLQRGVSLRRLRGFLALALILGSTLSPQLSAQTFTVTSNADTNTAGTLRWAMEQANAFAGASTINMNASLGTITLTGELPLLTNPAGITINGNGNTIDGGSTSNTTGFRVFFVGVGAGEAAVSPGLTATTNTSWAINDLAIQNANARGGNGGDGSKAAGAGAGLGGAIFVNAGELTLTNVDLTGNRAIGGNGGNYVAGSQGAGGGGGMGGNGGTGSTTTPGGAGGGGFGIGADGANGAGANGTNGSYTNGDSGGDGTNGGTGGAFGGGGGAGTTYISSNTTFRGAGGGGGIGGGNATGGLAGTGGFGGGAGGGGATAGNAGGYGGGSSGGFAPSSGGFGGGGSSSDPGGFGAGSSPTSGGGGGGLGAGAGIFVRQGANLIISDGSIQNGTVQGGSGGIGQNSIMGGDGQGIGSALFLAGASTFQVTAGNTVTISDTIGGGNDPLITGGLTKSGNGTLVLSGDNTYTGGTTVAGGTLSLAHNNAAGTGSITTTGSVIDYADGVTIANPIVINSNTTQLQVLTGSATQSGIVSETGGARPLEKTGAGTLTLSGTNTYSGGTTLSAGTLVIGNNSALGTGGLTIGDGTTLSQTPGNKTLANNLTIQGDFTRSAPGGGDQLILNGNVDLAGANRTMTMNTGNSIRFFGSLSNGGFTISGANALVSFEGTAANTYTGLTTVAGGTLSLAKNAGVTAIAGDLTIDSGAVVTQGFSDQIADTATVTVNGSYNLYDSSEIFSVLNGGGSITLFQSVANQSLSLGSGNFSGTISENVREDTQLIKFGTGTLTLSGANSYRGGTAINGGTLLVNNTARSGTGTGAVNVNNGGTLGGTGTISGAVTVNAGGTLAPGTSPGILTVGSLTLNAGSNSIFEINGLTPGTQHDQIVVTGTATLGGTLNLDWGTFTPSNGDTFTLIDAAAITGDFDAILSSLGANVALGSTITDDYILTVLGINPFFSTIPGLSPELLEIALILDNNFADPNLVPIINFINGLPGADQPSAFESINPDEFAALFGTTFANARNTLLRLNNRFRQLRNGTGAIDTSAFTLYDQSGLFKSNSLLAGTSMVPGTEMARVIEDDAPNTSLYVAGSGTFGDFDNDNNGPGYDYQAADVVIGLDYVTPHHTSIGGYVGYNNTDTNLGGNGGEVDGNSLRFGATSSWWGPEAPLSSRDKSNIQGRAYVEGTVGGAVHWYDNERNALGGTATSDTTAYELNTRGTLGYEFESGNWVFGPEASLNYVHLWTDGFTESGSVAPLTITDSENDSLYTTLGGRVSYLWDIQPVRVAPYVHAAWRHEFLNTRQSINARFASGGGATFNVAGIKPASDSLIAGAGFQMFFTDRITGDLSYFSETNSDFQTHSVNGSLTFWY